MRSILLLDQFVKTLFSGISPLCPVPVKNDLWIFSVRQQRQLSDACARIGGYGLQKCLIVAEHARDAIFIEQVGVVFQFQPDFVTVSVTKRNRSNLDSVG